MTRHQIDAALDEDPLLLDPAAPQFGRQLQAARRMMPEQIVGNEYVSPTEAKSRQTDSIDRSRTARACSCQIEQNEQRNGQPRAVSTSQTGTMRQARVLLVAIRRHDAEPAAARRRARTCRSRPPCAHARRRRPEAQAADIVRARASVERVSDARQHQLAIVEHHRRHVGHEERLGIRRRGMSADDDRDVRRPRAHPPRERQHVVGFERVHRRRCRRDLGARVRDAIRATLKRKSASVTSCPRASSAAAMYSIPSGSIRKKGPRPKRSFAGLDAAEGLASLSRRRVTYRGLIDVLVDMGRTDDARSSSALAFCLLARLGRRRAPSVVRHRRAHAASARRTRRYRRSARFFPRSAASTSCTSCSLLQTDIRSQITAIGSTHGSISCARLPKLTASTRALQIASRNVGWLADRQLLLLDDGTLDEALDRLRPEGTQRGGREPAASC